MVTERIIEPNVQQDAELIYLTVVLEKDHSSEIAGSIEEEDFLLTTVGNSKEEIEANLRMLLVDFLENEGKHTHRWRNVSIESVHFNYEYDITALFDQFNELKIGSIADRAGISRSLMRQYTSGTKNPSEKQAKKIEEAIHKLGEELQQVVVA